MLRLAGLNLPLLTVDERLDVLLHVKWTVKEFDCDLTREVVDLIDREADLLNRGRNPKVGPGSGGPMCMLLLLPLLGLLGLGFLASGDGAPARLDQGYQSLQGATVSAWCAMSACDRRAYKRCRPQHSAAGSTTHHAARHPAPA